MQMIRDRPVVAHAYDSLSAGHLVDRIIVVAGDSLTQSIAGALPSGHDAQIVKGGARRQDSVACGLDAIAASDPDDAIVLVHDAARPFVPATVIKDLIAAINGGADGAFPALPVADTLVSHDGGVIGDIVPRDSLLRVQTPQAFRLAALREAHAQWPTKDMATDCAQMVRASGGTVCWVEGHPLMEKITYPDDLARAEAMLSSDAPACIPCVGTGYDVHRLQSGQELWLCGLRIPHHKGLSGHSDADVAIHALVDAIFGALAEGDIGQHFPPSDPQWRGAQSDRFLAYAVDRVAQRGGRIAHVDLTIMCEEPKIGPHRDAMRVRLSELLRLPVARVSVKATTTERLGFTGRGEGIAAQAAATLLLPPV